MGYVTKISLETLMHMMQDMKVNDVIGLAASVWEEDGETEGEEWFAIQKIDLSKTDSIWQYWVIQYFGGYDSPRIISDYNEGEYLEDDLRKALKETELLKEDGVWIDRNDCKEE